MVAKPTAKRRKWFVERCEKGCEMCGGKFPNIKNNGLRFSHIISKKSGGNDAQANCLVLCPSCALSFDLVVKPAIYKALTEISKGKGPKSWEDGEGRIDI